MTFLKNLSCAAAIATFASSAYASPVLNDWVFNPNGGGYTAGQQINEYLDVNGNGFIELKRTSSTTFSFAEHAVFNSLQADSNGQPFQNNYAAGNISATLEAFGSGTYGETFSFTSGKIRMYQNPVSGQYGSTQGYFGANLGNQIAEFDIVIGGGGRVDANGSPINNGEVSVFTQAKPGMLMPGYFFDSKGNDLSKSPLMAFAFTNANTLSRPTTRLVNEVACQFAGFKGAGCGTGTYANVPGQHFFFGGNGQFKLAEVPEPASLALFGVALAAFGVARSRKQSA